METKKRTFCKVILLRIIVFILISISTVIIFKQSIMNGIEFAMLDIIIEFLTHYIYDRIWLRIKWGIVIENNDNDIELPEYKEEEKPKSIIYTI
jgi:ABC-type lipoprotein release transport system permease subunit